jgi:hypothetical protein
MSILGSNLTPKASQVCRAKAQSWFVRIAISHTFSLAFPRGWANFNPNTSDPAWRLGSVLEVDYAASALVTLGFGLETTNRKEGRRLCARLARTAATNSLKAVRFIVAMLPLW